MNRIARNFKLTMAHELIHYVGAYATDSELEDCGLEFARGANKREKPDGGDEALSGDGQAGGWVPGANPPRRPTGPGEGFPS